MNEYFAGTTTMTTLSFEDSSGNPITPASVTYTVTDQASGTVIISPTTVTPSGPSLAITVSAAQNALIARLIEVHELEATATDSHGNAIPQVECWKLKDPSLGCGCCPVI